MSKSEQQHAALKGIARACNAELKQVDSKNLKLLKSITDAFGTKAKLIGFSKTELLHQIGVLNGKLVDRRLDGY